MSSTLFGRASLASKLRVALVCVMLGLLMLADNGAQARAQGVASEEKLKAQISIPSEPLVRGLPGDYWADVIIGKPDFSEIAPGEVVPFKVFNPGGVFVDRSVSPGLAYVWDAGNSRVLGIDLAKCYANESPCYADVVLGQPSPYDHAACNGDSGVQNYPYRAPASAATLCGIPDLAGSPHETPSYVNMDVDSQGNLYIPDSFNNRVLLYEQPFELDGEADAVWGQESFSGFNCNEGNHWNPTARTLCFHSVNNVDRTPVYDGWPASGVDIDLDSNLWVADSGNNRVLRFPYDPALGRPSGAADLVLGQPDFHHRDPGHGMRNLFAPGALRLGPGGNLYVADTYNNRVVVFTPPFRSGMAATRTLGHSLLSPNGLEIDPDMRGIWVNDTAAHMVSLWSWESNRVLKVVGKANYQPEEDGLHFDEVPGGVRVHDVGGGIGFDGQGNLLITETSFAQDVLRFPSPIPDIDSGLVSRPDKRFFYPPGLPNFTGIRGLRDGDGVAVFQDQLVVSSEYRLMFWNGLETLTNGKPADGVIGDEEFRRRWPECCENIKADDAGRLWVNSSEGVAGFIDVYQLPLTHQSAPLETFWSKRQPFPVLGTNATLTIREGRIWGIAPAESGKFLWLSDTDNHRVLRIRDPLTAPVVDVILGQRSANEKLCNRRDLASDPLQRSEVAPDMLCFPGSLALDREGNLWVSDHALEVSGNFRLLMFSHSLFPTDNSTTVFAPPATKIFDQHGNADSQLQVGFEVAASSPLIQSQHRGPYRTASFEPAFDSRNRMVVGYNFYVGGRFVGVYDDPLGSSTQPSGYLNDLASMPVTAVFDDRDNLYIGDHNRARVLVYWNPFNNPPSTDFPPRPATTPAPLRDYPSHISAISPAPPSCVLRNATQQQQNTLTITVPDLSYSANIEIEVRKIAAKDHLRWSTDGRNVRVNGTQVSVSGIWSHLWREYEATWGTIRLLRNGSPFTSWSDSFIVADDAAECGDVRLPQSLTTVPPTLPISPTPTSAYTPTPLTSVLATATMLGPTSTPVPVLLPPSSTPELTPASVTNTSPSPVAVLPRIPPASPTPIPAYNPTPLPLQKATAMMVRPTPTPVPVPLLLSPAPVSTPASVTNTSPSPSAVAAVPRIPSSSETEPTAPAAAPVPESNGFTWPRNPLAWLALWVTGTLAVAAAIGYYLWRVVRD